MKKQFCMQKAKAFAKQLTWEFIGSIFIAAGILFPLLQVQRL